MHNIFYETHSLIIQKYSIEDLEVNFMVHIFIERLILKQELECVQPILFVCIVKYCLAKALTDIHIFTKTKNL